MPLIKFFKVGILTYGSKSTLQPPSAGIAQTDQSPDPVLIHDFDHYPTQLSTCSPVPESRISLRSLRARNVFYPKMRILPRLLRVLKSHVLQWAWGNEYGCHYKGLVSGTFQKYIHSTTIPYELANTLMKQSEGSFHA